tara:strand:+ start:515 stop:1540 length:1026 start_codon:yes stop_codon:yes gene_type:complete
MEREVTKSSPNTLNSDLTPESAARTVLIATIPGITATIFFYGPGILVNILWGSMIAVLIEMLALKLRKQSPLSTIKDFSAILTTTLLCMSIPPYSPWWLIAIGVFSSLILAKHIFGGAKQAIFNPAMIGYAVLLISFPIEMTSWQPSTHFSEAPTFLSALKACFAPDYFDGKTMATPLDILRHNKALTTSDLWLSHPQLGYWSGKGLEWISIAYLGSGLWMLKKGLFTWHAPFSMLLAITLASVVFYDYGSSASGGSPIFHLLSGGTMLGAFFIITQPGGSPRSAVGKIIFGGLIGILIYIIRSEGLYPDGIAFSVLVMNFATPLIDHLARPNNASKSNVA